MSGNDKTTWDAEMLAIAAGMKRAGFSAPAIAKRLGVTPKAVANKLSRIGAKRRLNGKPGLSSFPTGRISLNLLDVAPEEQTDG